MCQNTYIDPSSNRDSREVPRSVSWSVCVCPHGQTARDRRRAIAAIDARDVSTRLDRGVDMAKVPARLRSVTYSLSPMRTGVMHGLFKDWASGMATRVKENAVDAGVFCALPLGATVWCVEARRRRRETVTRR